MEKSAGKMGASEARAFEPELVTDDVPAAGPSSYPSSPPEELHLLSDGPLMTHSGRFQVQNQEQEENRRRQ